MRHWEDFHVGDVIELGSVEVTEEDVLEFARRFDPQPFHIDPVAAQESPFGGLIASGWHTAALFMGLFVRALLIDSSSLGSPGVEAIRWLVPVRPGDTLSARVTVAETRPSATKPGRGTVFTFSEVFNQRGELVMTLTARGLFARRAPAG